MKTLPLFYYPTRKLWIDDDSFFLEAMKQVFGKNFPMMTFTSAEEGLNFIRHYQSSQMKQDFLRSNREDENFGILKHTPVDFDITTLACLVDDKSKYDEISVVIIDYNMPEMSGTSFARNIFDTPMQKILLTGDAQEAEAISAFNANLIQCFIRKGEPNMEERLLNVFDELSFQYFQRTTYPLLAYLETEAKLPHTDPVFIRFFEEYCEKNKIQEYYLVDKQGSMLYIDSAGKKSCLVIQSNKGLDSWLSLYAKEKNLSEEDLLLLQKREKIPFFGVGKEAYEVNESWSSCLYETNILEGVNKYYWAVVHDI
jgi:CheY-like chemotaxis protein